ncbi:hypothetical protein J3B02_003597, partial [Coemansia erecta]
SLQHVLGGLYPGLEPGSSVFRVNVRPAEHETIFPRSSCRRMILMFRELSKKCIALHAAERQQLYAEMRSVPALQKHLDAAGYTPEMRHMAIPVLDTAVSAYAHGLPLPDAIDSAFLARLSQAAAVEYLLSAWKSTALTRMLIGPLLHEFSANVAAAVEKDRAGRAQQPKMAIYSAHDTTLAPLLATFGSSADSAETVTPAAAALPSEMLWPPFASSIRIELLKDSQSPYPPVRPAWEDDQKDYSQDASLIPFDNRVRPVNVPKSLYRWSHATKDEAAERNPRATRDYYVRVWYNDRALQLPTCRDPGAHHTRLGSSVCTLDGFFKQIARFAIIPCSVAKMSSRLVLIRALSAPSWTKNDYITRSFYTSNSVGNKLFSHRTKILVNNDKKPEQRSSKGQSSNVSDQQPNKVPFKRKNGKYDLDANMHMMVPVKARNVEKAWEIWSTQVRHTSISHREQLEQVCAMVKLLVEDANSTDAIGGPVSTNISTRRLIKQQLIARFRLVAILRDIFKSTADTIAAATTASSLENVSKQPVLTLYNVKNYRKLLFLLAKAQPFKSTQIGNSPTTIGKSAKELETYLDYVPVPRIAHLILLSATKESIPVTDELIKLALAAAILNKDVMAGRDSLLLFNPSLALLLDPQAPVDGKAYSSKDIAGVSEEIIDLLLRLIVVGKDPYETSEVALQDQQLQIDEQDSLSDMDSIAYSSNAEDNVQSTLDTVWNWRLETAERIYKAYVSAGISEVPSPDKSSMPSLQGTVVPSPPILVTMLGVFSNTGNVDQTIIVYDTLMATLAQSPCLNKDTAIGFWMRENMEKSPFFCDEAQREHKMNSSEWVRAFLFISKAKQDWLLARVLEDMYADGWVPAVALYERYLALLQEPSKELLESMIGLIRSIARFIEKPKIFVDNLVNALFRPKISLSEDLMKLRTEQALLISGLPLPPQQGTDSSVKQDMALVSDNTAHALIETLINNSEIDRARHLAEIWSTGRPGLINSSSLSKLILGLARDRRYAEALELFSDIQKMATHDVSVDMLGSVLQVYVHAGDFEEAVSVAKRI